MSKVRVGWNYPATRVLGGELAPGEISGVEITYVGPAGSAFGSVGFPVKEFLTGDLPLGTYTFGAVCVLTDGQKSRPVSISVEVKDTSPPEVLLDLSAVVEP